MNRIPISEAERRDYTDKLARMQIALDDAGIPGTFEWACVMLSAAAQVLVILGMERDFFLQLARDASCDLPVEPGPPDIGPLAGLRKDMKVKVMRLLLAIRDAEIDDGTEQAFVMISVAALQFAACGVTSDVFVQACTGAYSDAEKRVAALAARKAGGGGDERPN
jgi:hypothetical protein